MFKVKSEQNGQKNGSETGPDVATDAQMGPIESPTRPWYISTKAVSRMVNRASEAIKSHDRNGFEQALLGLTSAISIVASKNASRSLVINLESAPDLVDNLDALRSDQFNILNDGADDLRGRFARTLKELIFNIAEQKKMAADYLNERAIASLPGHGDHSISTSLSSAVPSVPSLPSAVTLPIVPPVSTVSTEMTTQTSSTTYHKTLQYLHPVLEQVKLRFPKSYAVLSLAVQQLQEAIGSKCEQVVNTVKQTIDKTDVVQLMLTAQPYAHAAYTNVAAVGASMNPTITAAVDPLRPYLEPLMQRAMEARTALMTHATMGPYINYALDRLYAAIELARLYCSIGDASAAVVSALTGVPQLELPDLPEVPEAPDVIAKAEKVSSDASQKVQALAENVPKEIQDGTQDLPEEMAKKVTVEAVKGVAAQESQEEPEAKQEDMDSLVKHLNEARAALGVPSRGKGKNKPVAEK